MNKEVQVSNIIFRDTVLGVLFLVAAMVLTFISPAATGIVRTGATILNAALAIGGIYFLQNAFKKDKYRLQIP